MATTAARLVVRDSTGRDVPVIVELDLPVRHVKEKIAELHPCHPPVSTQRLVFAGRLWQDDVTVQAALGAISHSVTAPESTESVPVAPAAHPALSASVSSPEPLSYQEKRQERAADASRVDRDMRAEIARRRLAATSTPTREPVMSSAPPTSPQSPFPSAEFASIATTSSPTAHGSTAHAAPLRRHASAPAGNPTSPTSIPVGAPVARLSGHIPVSGDRSAYSTQLVQALAAANHASAVAASMSPLNVHMGLGMGPIGPYGPSMLPYSPGTFQFTTNISNTPTFTGPTAMDSPLSLGPGALVAQAPPALNLTSTSQPQVARVPDAHVAPMSPLLAAVMQRQAEVAHQINLLQAAQQYNTLLSASPQLAALRASPAMSPHYMGGGSPLLDANAQSREMPVFHLPPTSSPVVGRQRSQRAGSKDVAQYKRRDMVDVSSPADLRRRRNAPGTSEDDSAADRRSRYRSSSDPFTDHTEEDHERLSEPLRQPAAIPAVDAPPPILPAERVPDVAIQPRPLGLRRFLDISLIIRLTVLCFVFFHGASPARLGFVVAVMTVFYLMRVGILQGLVRGVLDVCCGRPQPHIANAQPIAPHNEDLLRMFTDTVIAGSGSIIGDLFAFVCSFFVSLWPQWVPEDYLRRVPAPVAPAMPGAGA